MKTAVVGIVAFVLALGGSTGIAVWRGGGTAASGVGADSAHVAADSVRLTSDSVQLTTDSAGVPTDTASATAVAAAGDSTAASAPETAVRTAGAVGAARAPAATPSPARREPDLEAGYRALARLFTNMKPVDAAKVLAYLSDEEVEGVIRQMGARQAAGLLGAIPKERAAVVSRRILASEAAEAQR